MNEPARLAAISACMEELHRILDSRPQLMEADKWNLEVGYADQRVELSRLLREVE